MDLKVVSEKWGNYSKGDVLKDVPESTAKALIKSKHVEDANASKKKSTKKSK